MTHFSMRLLCCLFLALSVVARRNENAGVKVTTEMHMVKEHERSKHDGTEEATVHLHGPGENITNPKTLNAASVFVGSSASHKYLMTQRQVENGMAFTAQTFNQSKGPYPTMPYAGEYVPPGGSMNPGEDAEKAVKRELYEEVLSFWDGWTTGANGAQSLKVVQVEEIITDPFFHKNSQLWRNYNIKYFKLDVETAENEDLKPLLTEKGVAKVTAAYKAVESAWTSIKANRARQDAYLALPAENNYGDCKANHSPETHKAELMTLVEAIAATANDATDDWRDSEITRCGGKSKFPAGAHTLLKSGKGGF